MKRDYVNEREWQPEEIGSVLDLAGRVKKDPGVFRSRLEGKTLAMIFEKSSTRTRVSFEAGMFQLGGLAIFLTVRERFGTERGFPLCYVGDGNNVANSLLLTGAKLGARVAVVTPPGFEPPAQVLAWAREAVFDTGGSVLATHSLEEGLSGARAVYTDVWASMGQEAQAADRAQKFEKYRVTPGVFAMAAPDAIFLHCR